MAQPQQLNYTHFVAVKSPDYNDLIIHPQWINTKNEVYYGSSSNIQNPIQSGVFVMSTGGDINDAFIRHAIDYLYNKRTARGKEDFEVEKKQIFGEGKNDDVLFLGMKKVNEIYTGHIVKKIAQDKMAKVLANTLQST